MIHRSYRRGAFTLVELLVVIAIIAILVAIIGAGVINYLKKGPEMVTKNDITQLSESLQNFKGRYKFYPPQKIKLCCYLSSYDQSLNAANQPNSPLDFDSVSILNRMFPSISKGGPSADFNDMPPGGNPNARGIPWSDGQYPGNKPMVKGTFWILEGDQCLTFFLGGIPMVGGAQGFQGFSNNPLNPAVSVGVADRSPSLYEFKSSRLRPRKVGTPFFSYYDAWDKLPYVYFSSSQRYNYNYSIAPDPSHNPPIPQLSPYHFPIAAGMPNSATGTKYHAPDSFQIISGGADWDFNPGTPSPGGPPTYRYFNWSPAIALGVPQAAKDDWTNFYMNQMGVPQ